MVRVRFAPSPTGYLHIGNTRTALFNWLFARKNKGAFILRIEDTDRARSDEVYIQQIFSDLRWLGIEWDEGPDVGGEYGPYQQSDRVQNYIRFAKQLLDQGRAYYCYCSQANLEARRKQALEQGFAPRYDNRCRDLTESQRKAHEEQGIKPCIRMRVPEGEVVVDDIVRGRVRFDLGIVGDFVIMKAGMSPAFNFAVVVDDCLMKISHVIRGDDHLSNTARHIILFEALGYPKPRFAHMAMTLGPDRSRLSKRHGAISISEYRSCGYLPEALINYMALLGFTPSGGKEVLSREELIQDFELERLSKSPDMFDQKRLDWLGGLYIRGYDLDKLTDLAVPYLKESGMLKEPISQDRFDWLKEVVGAVRDHLSHISQITDYVDIFFEADRKTEEDAKELLETKEAKDILESLKKALGAVDHIDNENFKTLIKNAAMDSGIKGKDLYLTIRAALTGRLHGPELVMIVSLLGKKRCIERIDRALKEV